MDERIISAGQMNAPTQKPSGLLQRKCACGQHTVAGGECEGCNEKRLQRQATGQAMPDAVPEIVHDVLRTPGQPLDAQTRAFMEPRFGRDFSQVRTHTDARAAESARAVNALAYTVGRNIVFGKEQYAPMASQGRLLLAHELSHVAQQTDGRLPLIGISSPGDASEREADLMADRALAGGQPINAPMASPIFSLQRAAIASCEDGEKTKIEKALNTAASDLAAALAALSGPMTPLLQNVLWLTLRSKGDAADIASVVSDLTAVKTRLPGASIECSDKGILVCSGESDRGATNTITKTIFICKAALKEMNDFLLARTLIHEGLHAFASKNAGGELYLDDDCSPSDEVGTSRRFRLNNADSIACCAMRLAHSAGADLSGEVAQSKGENIKLQQKPPGPITLSEPEATPEFELSGYSGVGVTGIRWILKDDAGRRYFLRRGTEIIDPTERVQWIGKIIIGNKTRALLRERGITSVQLFAVVDIPEVGQKTIQLDLTLKP